MPRRLELVSHLLCPYVQRALIVAAETATPLERTYIDLADKPAWFTAISPTGKVPLLRVGDGASEAVLFESAAISEYLDETSGRALMPDEPLERARTRAWVEFASGTLGDIAGLYGASDEAAFTAKVAMLGRRFAQVDAALRGPWFAGARFGLVDAAFAPVFRYLDAFEALAGLELAEELDRLASWRAALARRPSVAGAVLPAFRDGLDRFLATRDSHIGRFIRGAQG